tara:strand:- start:80211 stop:80483 length:273 start_codon:yes stop_codon:yes gene_type:complete
LVYVSKFLQLHQELLVQCFHGFEHLLVCLITLRLGFRAFGFSRQTQRFILFQALKISPRFAKKPCNGLLGLNHFRFAGRSAIRQNRCCRW